MKTYTRLGDNGTTKAGITGHCSKSSIVIKAAGEVDELQAWLGFLHSKYGMKEELENIMRKLGEVAVQAINGKSYKELVHKKDVEDLEYLIDTLAESLPPEKSAVLPIWAPEAHIARTVCRRAERTVNRLPAVHEGNSRYLVPYLNRLSDFLFVYAKYHGAPIQQKAENYY
jgi:cob(I)alamin adenosyltransferase